MLQVPGSATFVLNSKPVIILWFLNLLIISVLSGESLCCILYVQCSFCVTFEGFWIPLLLKRGIFLIPLSLGCFFGLGFWFWVCFIFLILLIRT